MAMDIRRFFKGGKKKPARGLAQLARASAACSPSTPGGGHAPTPSAPRRAANAELKRPAPARPATEVAAGGKRHRSSAGLARFLTVESVTAGSSPAIKRRTTLVGDATEAPKAGSRAGKSTLLAQLAEPRMGAAASASAPAPAPAPAPGSTPAGQQSHLDDKFGRPSQPPGAPLRLPCPSLAAHARAAARPTQRPAAVPAGVNLKPPPPPAARRPHTNRSSRSHRLRLRRDAGHGAGARA